MERANWRPGWSTSRPLRPTAGLPNNSIPSSRLGTTALVFIGLGASIAVLVLLSCMYLVWRTSRRARLGYPLESRIRTGRAVERRSFFSFAHFYNSEPVVLQVPDSPDELPNYSVRTPYTFPSSVFSDSTDSSRTSKVSFNSDLPSSRATIS